MNENENKGDETKNNSNMILQPKYGWYNNNNEDGVLKISNRQECTPELSWVLGNQGWISQRVKASLILSQDELLVLT